MPDSPRRASKRKGQGNGRPTLQTVADAVGVSHTTVSNAYSRPDQLSPVLRERILQAAADLGYSGPNAVARRLRVGRAGAVGLLFTEELSYAFDDPAAVLFLAGVAETFQAQDVGLLLVPAHPGGVFDEGGVRDAVVDGFLIYSVSDSHAGTAAVLQRGLPTVVVDQPSDRGTAFVGIDDAGGARAVAEHLIALGHRDVAILTDRLSATVPSSPVVISDDAGSDYQVARDRLAGYRLALERVGVEWASVLHLECFPNTPATGALALVKLLDHGPLPTAIISMTDQLAIGALNAAAERGIRVPEDLSVVGFDDIPAASTTGPGLTTVRQPLREKGRLAAELLLLTSDTGRRDHQMLDTELIVRGSTGRPATE